MLPKIKKIALRFYEELNDFLPEKKRKIDFEHEYIDRVSIKDVIESYSVPHTEIELEPNIKKITLRFYEELNDLLQYI